MLNYQGAGQILDLPYFGEKSFTSITISIANNKIITLMLIMIRIVLEIKFQGKRQNRGEVR